MSNSQQNKDKKEKQGTNNTNKEQTQNKKEEKVKDKNKQEKQDTKKDETESKKEEKNQDYLEISQRIQAEFDNYRKRTQMLAAKYQEEGMISVIKKLFPIMDSFKSAKKAAKDEELKGINQIESQFNKVLEELNVKKIKAKGEQFDPNFHEAVMTDTSDDSSAKEGTILEVLQDGYKIGDRVIRYAMVKIKG